jgi:hypothetical protein
MYIHSARYIYIFFLNFLNLGLSGDFYAGNLSSGVLNIKYQGNCTTLELPGVQISSTNISRPYLLHINLV